MKILILSWRDIKNPASGGAEVLTHEIVKRWVKAHKQVTVISSMFEDAPKEEIIDGVRIIRRGHADARWLFWSVHFLAFLEYQKNFKGKVDMVIDQVHGLPFFTPLYVKEKKIALICEVAGELWFKVFDLFFGAMGRLAEKLYLGMIYRNMHFLTISQSTKAELIRNDIEAEHITVIPMGIQKPYLKLPSKEKVPTLIFVGRLSKTKGIEDAIQVFDNILKTIPKAQFWIVGRGDQNYTNYLKQKVRTKNLNYKISFFGHVTDDEKFKLMSRAHILISPSVKEGFGLTIPEAGSVGTPAIAYNVAGLRDLITHNKDGILVEPNWRAMADKIIALLEDKNRYRNLQKHAKISAKRFDFENSAKVALSILSRL